MPGIYPLLLIWMRLCASHIFICKSRANSGGRILPHICALLIFTKIWSVGFLTLMPIFWRHFFGTWLWSANIMTLWPYGGLPCHLRDILSPYDKMPCLCRALSHVHGEMIGHYPDMMEGLCLWCCLPSYVYSLCAGYCPCLSLKGGDFLHGSSWRRQYFAVQCYKIYIYLHKCLIPIMGLSPCFFMEIIRRKLRITSC